MTTFQPKGDTAKWVPMYELIASTERGGIVTYDELAEAGGIDPADRHAVQQHARRAIRESEQKDKRALSVVRGTGYRVAQAAEHVALARRHQRRSVRQLTFARSKVENVDLGELTPDEREVNSAAVNLLAAQSEAIRRLDIRQRHLAAAVVAIGQQQVEDGRDIEALRDRLARVESLLAQKDHPGEATQG